MLLMFAALVPLLGAIYAFREKDARRLHRVTAASVILSALLASAAVWGTQLMVNQLGYVYAGLDGVDTIMPWIYFMVCTVCGMLLSIFASFARVSLNKA